MSTEGGGLWGRPGAGVRGECAVGVSEKGYRTVEVHGQQPAAIPPPPRQTSIGILARAWPPGAHPMPDPPAPGCPMYHGIGKALPSYTSCFRQHLAIRPLLKRWLVPIAEMNASIRTTTP